MMERTEQLTQELIHRLFVEVEASARHVHLTADDAQTLFGHDLTPARPLSQPGQYLCKERVWVRGPKGEFPRVAVLGPVRKETQVEISLTDCFTLGIQAPVRLSGDTKDTPGICIGTDRAQLALKKGVIVAKRHIHMPPEEAKCRGLQDRQMVKLRCLSARPTTFEKVCVRVHPEFAPYAHIDLDEANACGLRPGDLALIIP